MKLRKPIYLLLLASVTAWFTACSNSSSSAPPPPTSISVTLSAPASLLQGTTASLTAVVSNDSKNAGVTWSVTCGSSQCGSISPTKTASGATTTYTAPATAASLNVTVIATSVTDSSKSASATITITAAAQPISVSFDPQPPATVANGATASLTAVVSNDSKNAGVTWSVTCGSSQCGSFNPTNTASGSATTYTAPTTAPTPNTVTVTATSVTDTTKSATATIAIANPPPVVADGTYVFHLSGYDLYQQNGAAPYFVAGTFIVKGGVITGGEQDFIDYYDGAFTNSISASGSGLTNAGGNIQVVLNTGNSSIGVGGVETIRGAVVSSSRVLISEFDAAASGTGSIDLQTSTAAPSGGYVFNLLGLDGTQNGNPLAIGGVLNIAGSSINVGGGMSIFDLNDGDGTINQAQPFASGSVTAPDSYGRITFTLTPATVTTEFPNVILVGYIVGANRIQLVEGQNDLLDGALGGTALGQGTNTGQFSQASILNTGYVFLANGEDANNGIAQLAGGFVFNPAGAMTGDLVINDLGCCGGTATTGNYTIDSTGRVTISNVTPTLIENVPFVFQLYLDGNGNALELGVDESQLSAGPAYLQNAPSSYAGTFAVSAQGYGNFQSGLVPWSATGSTTISSNTFNGFTDFNTLGLQLNSDVGLTGTSSTTEPVYTLTGLNAANPGTSNNYGVYPIDSTRVLAIEVDQNAANTQLGVLLLEGTTQP